MGGKPAEGILKVKNHYGIVINHRTCIRIGISGSNTVTRFPANDPGMAKEFKVGYSPLGIAIDSQGNAWVANPLSRPGTMEKLALLKQKIDAKDEERQPFLAIPYGRLDWQALSNCLAMQV